MLNKEYKLLRFIEKKERITKKDLLEKFPDVEKTQHYIGRYIFIEDDNAKLREEQEEKLILETVGLNISESAKYVHENMKEIKSDNSKIYYSINHDGMEYLQNKRQSKLSFILPYSITTVIALMSIIVQLIDLFMG